MSDPFKKVHAGQKLEIPAVAYNAFIDAALAVRNSKINIAPNKVPIINTIYVRNNSSSDCPRFGILGIDSPIISPESNLQAFQTDIALTGTTPSLPTHVNRFAIAQEPIPVGRIGRAIIDGISIAKVHFPYRGPTRTYAEVSSSVEYLTAYPAGSAKILWAENGTGMRWAVVRIGQFVSPTIKFTLGQTLAKDSGATVEANLHDWGNTGWTYNASAHDTMNAADVHGLGFYGAAGTVGIGQVVFTQNPIVAIIDMRCG